MLNCYFDKLPEEIIEGILLYIPFENARCVNKQFKYIRDKYELRQGKCLIIESEMVHNHIFSGPSFYTIAWISDQIYCEPYINYQRASRREDDIYMHKCGLKNIYKGNWYDINKCDNYKLQRRYEIYISDRLLQHLSYPYQKIQLSSRLTYLPTFNNIIYYLLKHPLATSETFVNKSILKTINHYRDFIKVYDTFNSFRNKLLSEYDNIITTEAGINKISDIYMREHF
jgi:hypothetical protein